MSTAQQENIAPVPAPVTAGVQANVAGKKRAGAADGAPAKATAPKKAKASAIKLKMPAPFHQESDFSGKKTKPKYHKLCIPASQDVPYGFAAVPVPDCAAANSFHVHYKVDSWDPQYKDHFVCFTPKVPLELQVVEHGEMFDYNPGCYEVEPKCPVCNMWSAECYDVKNPLTEHITKAGFDAYDWVGKRVQGEVDEEHGALRVCKSGHITLAVAEEL